MKYTIKTIEEVFSPDYLDYVATTLQGEPGSTKVLQQTMKEIEHYETKRSVEFVTFLGKDLLIFKSKG